MFLLVCVILLIWPERAAEGAMEGLKVAFETVIPSILPFSVLSSAMIFSGQAEKFASRFSAIFKKLRLNPYGAIAFFTGLMGGYPTGCKVVCDMYSQNLINKKEAEKMLAYVNNGGVVFAVNVCGNIYFSDKRIGVAVFCVSAAAAFITGLIMAKSSDEGNIEIKKEQSSLMTVVGKSIASGGSVIVNIISVFVVFYALSNAFGLYKLPFFEGLWEMTKGIAYAGRVQSPALAALYFSFGGVSVLAQSGAIAEKYSFNMKYHLAGKIISGMVSFVALYVLTKTMADFYIAVFCLVTIVCVTAGWKILKKTLKMRAD